MSRRYIVRAESMSRARLQEAVTALGAAGINCETWAMDSVFVGHALIAVEIEETDVSRVQEVVWEFNYGRFVSVNPDVDYDEEYSTLGVDIPR